MKKLLLLPLLFLFLVNCEKDEPQYELYTVAKPQTMSKAEYWDTWEIQPTQEIDQSGKIYAYNQYIFINEEYQGVHVIDNRNPESPQNIAFLKIPGNVDIAVKDNYLYADSGSDLVVFNISDINNITYESVLPAVLQSYYSIMSEEMPEEATYFDYAGVDLNQEIIVGWTLTQELVEVNEHYGGVYWMDGGLASNDSGAEQVSQTGQGGSLARFQIINDFLYTVGFSDMNIFNISDLNSPVLSGTLSAGWNIETMFYADNHLYLGSTDGMYIYGMDDPANPNYISEFIHWTGCDPVVVDGDYAYLTLRGGNPCGQMESVLEVIDVSDKTNPTLVSQYTMENPYGLGFKDKLLFVCDGTAGLKLYDKTDPLNLTFVDEYSVEGKDVIPMEDKLLMIGDGILYQYHYTEGSIELLSAFNL